MLDLRGDVIVGHFLPGLGKSLRCQRYFVAPDQEPQGRHWLGHNSPGASPGAQGQVVGTVTSVLRAGLAKGVPE